MLAKCLSEGFAFQGEHSPFRGGASRGEPSAHLPPDAFVSFLQNHDQIGNRALGERLSRLCPDDALAAATTLLLLAPQPPLLFMGEEWGAQEPFPFFCDFSGGLAEQVRAGRQREFARFPAFASAGASLPDPCAEATFRSAVLRWGDAAREAGRDWLDLHRRLIALRAAEIAPRLRQGKAQVVRCERLAPGLRIDWRFAGGSLLAVLANLTREAGRSEALPPGALLAATSTDLPESLQAGMLPAFSVAWYLLP